LRHYQWENRYVVKELGLIQTINKDSIKSVVEDFGATSKNFEERWKGEYWTGEGDHFLSADDPKELAETILDLYSNKRERLRLSNNALDWINKYGENWQPVDKGKTILEVAGLD